MAILDNDIQYEIENVDYNKFGISRKSWIYIPKIKFIDKDKKEISSYGGDTIEFTFNNKFDQSDHSLSISLFNALSHFLTEFTLPFIKHTCDGNTSITEFYPEKESDYTFLLGFCKYYPDFTKKISEIIKLIDSKIYMKNTLLWFSYGIESKKRLDKFFHYYRVIETLSNEYYSQKIKTIQIFLNTELKEFPDLVPHNILPNKERVSHFLKVNGVECKIITKIEELRNKKIAHGTDATLEESSSISDTNSQLKTICRKLICQELGLKVEELEFIQHEYFCYHKMDSNEIYFLNSDTYLDIVLKDFGKRKVISLDKLSEQEIIDIFKEYKIKKPSLENVLFSKKYYNAMSIMQVWLK